jgi:type I restriction enzyme S subunit
MKDIPFTEAQLLSLYDRVVEAEDAIPRLRRFVLDLAVRGKLVPQEAGDDPASVLLARIEKEKARLVKAGEIRKPKPFEPVEDAPFDVPRNWAWSRIREVTTDRGQMIPNAPFTYIDVSAINKEAGAIEAPTVLDPTEAPSRARKIVRKGDVIYSCVRPYLLNVAVVEDEIEPAPIASTAFAIINGLGLILPRFIWIVLRSPFMVAAVEETQRGQAYPAINDADFAVLPFPLPPLAEQHRIVAKVEELMALLDRLEAARAAREETRTHLTAATLSRLTEADTDTPTAARFALQSLPALTTRPNQIKTLRQTILNLAVRGTLVEQDAGDEPADNLLKSISSGASPSRKRNKFGDAGHTVERHTDQILPQNWAWTTLAEISGSMRYGTSVKCERDLKGVPVLRIPNVSNGVVNLNDLKFGPLSEDEKRDLSLRAGDLLLIRSNGSLEIVGRSAVVTEQAEGMAFAGYLVRVRLAAETIVPSYVWLVLNSSSIREQIEKPIRSAVGLKNVNLTEFGALSIPLPPLAEQHRIVAKVEELMSLCDRLERALQDATTTRAHLLDATLREALHQTEPA